MSSLTIRKYKVFVVFIAAVFLCLLYLAGSSPLKINSSVLAMLPSSSLSTQSESVNDAFLQRIDKQLIFLLKTKDMGINDVDAFVAKIVDTGFIDTVKYKVSKSEQQEYAKFFYTYKNALIDHVSQQKLEHGGQSYAEFILSELYSGFSMLGGQELKNDPLLLIRSRVKNLSGMNSKIQIRQDYLTVNDAAGDTYYFIHATHNLGAFDTKQSERFVLTLNDIFSKFDNKGCTVLYRGAIFYSYDAARLAQDDVFKLGLLTVALIFVLIFAVYRSIYPLLLTLSSIAFGALVGFTITYSIFGQIHLLTIVMSISIIGISADYSIYYATQRFINENSDTPQMSAIRIRKTLFFALSTIVVSYLILMIAPFSSIRQLSLFAASGLIGSCLVAVYLGPYICARVRHKDITFTLVLNYLKLFEKRPFVITLFVITLMLCTIGLSRVQINDDVSALQKLPDNLVAMEKKITALTGQRTDQKLIMISAADDEQLLINYEKVHNKLQDFTDKGIISGFISFPVRSLAAQRHNIELVKSVKDEVLKALNEIGMSDINYSTELKPLYIEDFLKSSASYGFDMMYMGLDDVKALVIPVYDVTDSKAVSDLQKSYDFLSYIDRKDSLEKLFGFYRTVISYLIGLALICMFAVSIFKLGFKDALRSFAVTLISLLCALASTGILGYQLNLFSTLALVLVIGIGINYIAFFTNFKTTAKVAFVSSTLAMLTTIFTLGILVFSHTSAIAGFGLVLTTGVIANYIFAPFARVNKNV